MNECMTACMCWPLFVFTLSCADINECEENQAACAEKAHCVNTGGSYRCECNTGYEGSGVECHGTSYVITSLRHDVTTSLAIW